MYVVPSLSDSSLVSDNLRSYRMLLVRFLPGIGQPAILPHVACPIFPWYRTTCDPSACCLSDSYPVSDNLRSFRMLLVRFLPGIGQPMILHMLLVRFFSGIGQPAILPDGSARIKKAEPEIGPAFCFVLSVLFVFFRRTRSLRHRLKRGSFVPMLNGNHSILR